MRERWWKTAGDVVVREVGRCLAKSAAGAYGVKIYAVRATGGYHGALWLKNLTRAKPPRKATP